MNKRLTTVAFALSLSAGMLSGCDKKEGSAKSENPLDAMKTAAGDAAKKAQDEVGKKVEESYTALRDAASTTAEKTLQEAKSSINLLKEKAAAASADAKPAMDSAIKGIEDQWAKVQAKLPELKAATSETWKSVSESVTSEGNKLMEMVKSAMEKYGIK